jgi:hypothetical protein
VGEGNKLISALTVDDQPVIRAVASVTNSLFMTLGWASQRLRQLAAPDGASAVASELLDFRRPFVVDLDEATVEDVEFRFPDGEPAAWLAPLQPLGVLSVLRCKVTFHLLDGTAHPRRPGARRGLRSQHEEGGAHGCPRGRDLRQEGRRRAHPRLTRCTTTSQTRTSTPGIRPPVVPSRSP